LPLPSLLLEESEGSLVGRAIRNPPIGLFGREGAAAGPSAGIKRRKWSSGPPPETWTRRTEFEKEDRREYRREGFRSNFKNIK